MAKNLHNTKKGPGRKHLNGVIVDNPVTNFQKIVTRANLKKFEEAYEKAMKKAEEQERLKTRQK